MKRLNFAFNKKICCFWAVLCGISFGLFAFDFGSVVTNGTSFESPNTSDYELVQKNSVSAWLKTPLGKAGKGDFSANFVYNFEFDKENETYKNILDLNLFAFSYADETDNFSYNLKAGRFSFSDLTGNIFTQIADGVKFGFKNNVCSVNVYGSYTGLLNALNTEMITTSLKNDNGLFTEDSSTSFNADYDKVYDFANKYAVADLCISFPNLFKNQGISLEGLGSFSLEGDTFNRMYATLSFEGPIYSSLFYNLSSTFGFINFDDETNVSNLSKVKIEYFFKKVVVGINGLYASGSQGFLKEFVGITKNTSTYSSQSFLYSGLITGGANFAFRPDNSVLVFASADSVFNAASGDDNEDIEYFGFQYSLGTLWQVKSDFSVGFSLCQFIDKDNSEKLSKNSLTLNATLAF